MNGRKISVGFGLALVVGGLVFAHEWFRRKSKRVFAAEGQFYEVPDPSKDPVEGPDFETVDDFGDGGGYPQIYPFGFKPTRRL